MTRETLILLRGLLDQVQIPVRAPDFMVQAMAAEKAKTELDEALAACEETE